MRSSLPIVRAFPIIKLLLNLRETLRVNFFYLSVKVCSLRAMCHICIMPCALNREKEEGIEGNRRSRDVSRSEYAICQCAIRKYVSGGNLLSRK